MFTQWDEFTAWGLAPKMVVARRVLCGRSVNLKPALPTGHQPGDVLVPALWFVG